MTIACAKVLLPTGIWLLVAAASPAAAQAPAGQPSNGCLRCHAGLAAAPLSAPVALFRDDVHATRGFTCVDCHGGDPSTDDKAGAKDPKRGYRGKPTGLTIVTVCARCHSDAALMRRYAPRQRVDQAAEYATSVHGQQLAKGDTNVAECASCHGAHGIRMVSDAQSPIFPLNVAATCAKCHADPVHMESYVLPGGSPIPTNQHAEYEKSVHFEALTKSNDLSAPTCNDCHGNHGAAPPGVGSVVNVCGTCHAVFQTRYAKSTHSQLFECIQCHGNHAVHPTSDDMLGTEPPSLCVECHGEGDNGYQAAASMRGEIERLKMQLAASRALIDRAANAGMEMSDEDLALGEVRNRLTLARTEIHAFDPMVVSPVIEEGLEILAEVDVAGHGALEELRFRRTGLAISLGAILIVVVALALKIREIERAQGLH